MKETKIKREKLPKVPFFTVSFYNEANKALHDLYDNAGDLICFGNSVGANSWIIKGILSTHFRDCGITHIIFNYTTEHYNRCDFYDIDGQFVETEYENKPKEEN
ncbi:MAG: hypothetical protein FWE53_02410 [Firmicutes bacterium]|nr:hypothetical protein [Bacillota bacterium]